MHGDGLPVGTADVEKDQRHDERRKQSDAHQFRQGGESPRKFAKREARSDGLRYGMNRGARPNAERGITKVQRRPETEAETSERFPSGSPCPPTK